MKKEKIIKGILSGIILSATVVVYFVADKPKAQNPIINVAIDHIIDDDIVTEPIGNTYKLATIYKYGKFIGMGNYDNYVFHIIDPPEAEENEILILTIDDMDTPDNFQDDRIIAID